MKHLLFLLALFSFLYFGACEKICSNGFKLVNGKCLALVRQLRDYYDAEDFCRLTDGSVLVQPKSLQEHNDLVHFLSGTPVANVWMGLRCNGYPNNVGSCVQLTAFPTEPGLWYSRQCSVKMAFVCELPPTERDCQANCGINYNNHCYQVYDQQKSFNNSEAYCQLQQRSHLVSIHSYLEWRFVAEMFRRQGQYWIGGTIDINKKLSWIDGTSGAYSPLILYNGGPCLQFGVDSTATGTYYYGKECEDRAVFMCKRPAKC